MLDAGPELRVLDGGEELARAELRLLDDLAGIVAGGQHDAPAQRLVVELATGLAGEEGAEGLLEPRRSRAVR